MDGTSRTVLHSTGLSTVYGLTLDYANQILYWADYNNNRIEKSFANGSNRVLVTSTAIINPWTITFYDGILYWTVWNQNSLYKLNLSTPSIVTRIVNVGSDPYGIHVVTEERQPEGMLIMLQASHNASYFILSLFIIHTAYNDCLGNNCSHICVLSASHASHGYRCLCPVGLELDDTMSDCRGIIQRHFDLQVINFVVCSTIRSPVHSSCQHPAN